eukprot:TRINITY_DN54_c0_g1_i8.p1 TRINITY_DN54_c0_g1~~TRINITY_DN54_c0_g1_i8.p1  ORF type:complete len:118 (+),score=15.25 TRINITY_DN54_c0_g1_i8:180-533(+)
MFAFLFVMVSCFATGPSRLSQENLKLEQANSVLLNALRGLATETKVGQRWGTEYQPVAAETYPSGCYSATIRAKLAGADEDYGMKYDSCRGGDVVVGYETGSIVCCPMSDWESFQDF